MIPLWPLEVVNDIKGGSSNSLYLTLCSSPVRCPAARIHEWVCGACEQRRDGGGGREKTRLTLTILKEKKREINGRI